MDWWCVVCDASPCSRKVFYSFIFSHGIIWEDDKAAGGSVDCGGRGSNWFSPACVSLPPPATGKGTAAARLGWRGLWTWRWRWRSHLLLPSLHPTIVHGSILSPPFILLLSSILMQPAWPCFLPRLCGLPYIHFTYLSTQRIEIRVSFIILYKLPSWLPGTNSEGNRMANSLDRLYYRHQ